MITRRTLLMAGTAALAPAWGARAVAPPKQSFEVTRSDAEWRRLLTADQYAVLRQEDTEVAGSSPLNGEKRKGTYHCAGCDAPVYASDTKFESGTGWPSFYAPLENAVGTRVDRKLVFLTRTEVHCRRCGGHLGHVFDDGPPPTGLRHCLNGVALKFVPAEA
ncbi:MAG TPA: peptide-methionine (R)-S-oxide reductase MsrB [Microvirga sp.]|jgi:peptide-methionine (R)-S-oxide reductase|nr:peptide-methionine (R)-S-oxide reductase MsrB [Microvirga sp.]